MLNITNHQGKANQNHNEYHLIPVRMTFVKKTTYNKCWQGCEEKGTLVHCWWECKLVQPLWKTVWRFLKKLKIELPYDLAIPILAIYIQKPHKNTNLKRYMHPNVHRALFTIAKIWKQPKCPSTDDWIKKIWYIYDGVLFRHKKEWNFAICNNMGGPREDYAKWNKSHRERQILYDITYMWNLKNPTNLTKKEADSQIQRTN